MARYDLGLSDDEFGRIGPAGYAALLERHQLAERRADARAAIITTVILNAIRDKDDRATELEDVIAMLALLPEEPGWLAGLKAVN